MERTEKSFDFGLIVCGVLRKTRPSPPNIAIAASLAYLLVVSSATITFFNVVSPLK
jgi:hypothetical protein